MKDRRPMMPVTGFLLGRQVRRAVRRIGVPVAATIIIAPHREVFGYAGEKVKVYLAADDYPAGASLMSLPRDRIAALELKIAHAADYVVVSSPTNQERWRQKGFEAHFLPHGVDVDALAAVDGAQPPDDLEVESPAAVLMGHISPRVDLTLLEALAESGVSVLIIGPSRFHDDSLEKLTRHPRVRWIGFRPFSELPRYLKVSDVGLVPYAQIEFNQASFPLKTLEYLAGGLPVVSTDLPSVRWLAAPDVEIAGDPDEFVAAVKAAALGRWDPAKLSRRREFASHHSWESRARQFTEMIGI
jgi:glycosyltransferase involved in cell wall biosynthesis